MWHIFTCRTLMVMVENGLRRDAVGAAGLVGPRLPLQHPLVRGDGLVPLTADCSDVTAQDARPLAQLRVMLVYYTPLHHYALGCSKAQRSRHTNSCCLLWCLCAESGMRVTPAVWPLCSGSRNNLICLSSCRTTSRG